MKSLRRQIKAGYTQANCRQRKKHAIEILNESTDGAPDAKLET